MSSNPPIVGAIEAGGTKFVCAVGRGAMGDLLDSVEFPTGSDPQVVLGKVIDWLKAREAAFGALPAIGIASFGPVDLDPTSRTYGHITTTPKEGWKNTDIVGVVRRAFPGRAIGFDTDVNGAALGEGRWGCARGLEDFIYVTVGTGIGGGGFARGQPLHGLVHPEMGHIPLPPIGDDEFRGSCAIHGGCWEGFCAGPAIERRAGMPAKSIPADHPVWEFTARSMAQALLTLTYVLSPRRIIVGGSVRKAGQLGEDAFFAKIRRHFHELNNGYISSPALSAKGLETFIVPPELGDSAGVCGAVALGQDALRAGG
ncbi:MAG: ROK family protein [bacterium]